MNNSLPPPDPRKPEPETPAAPPPIMRPAPARQAPFTPWVTYSLLAITIIVFLAQIASQTLSGNDWVADYGLKINERIAQGEYWRLITPMFLHSSGSLLHIGFNMYALFVLGPGLERYYGRGRFLGLYALSGFAGNVASLMFSAADSLGSSTAIFGLLGAQGIFMYQNQEVLGSVARRALQSILVIAGINLFIGLLPGIDNWGHLGGLAGGTLFAWAGGPLLKVEGLFPTLSVRDVREPGDTLRAGLLVALLFAALATATLFLRGQ